MECLDKHLLAQVVNLYLAAAISNLDNLQLQQVYSEVLQVNNQLVNFLQAQLLNL